MDVTDAQAAGRQRVVGLPDLGRVPLRRWRTVLAVTLLITVAGVGYLLLGPARYTATCVVVVRPVLIDPFTYPSGGADRAVNMTAENGIATGNEVIDKAAAATGRTPDEVRGLLEIETPVGGQVLRFTFVGRSQGEAVAGANTAAGTYLQLRGGVYEAQRDALVKSYDGTIKQVTAQRRAAQKALPARVEQGSATPPAAQAVLDQLRAMNEQLAQLAEQRAKVDAADLSPGVVASAAREPVPSSHDPVALYLLGAVLGGALLGAIAAHARETFDRRVRSPAQAAEVSGLPVLGVVRADARRGGASVDADHRYVALAVADRIDRQPGRPLVLLSSRADEGRTGVAGGVAVALAEAGREVYLGGTAGSLDELRELLRAAVRRRVGTPVASPQRGEPLFVPPQRPAVNRYAGDNPVQEVIGLTFARMVDTATATAPGGGPPGGPAGQPIGAGSLRLGPCEQWSGAALVVNDAPAADSDERGVHLARAGVAVLVVAVDRTRQVELARLVDRLRAAGAEAIGVVVTGARRD